MQTSIQIGELSRRTGCNVETVRYYERIGLLPRPARSGGRFRRYGSPDVARLKFIRRARQLGFALGEVRQLLRLAAGEGADVCAETHSLATVHVAEIRAKIADLQAMERVLAEAIRACETGGRPACPLLEVLAADADRSSPAKLP